jgi:Tol biopolymer transport system component
LGSRVSRSAIRTPDLSDRPRARVLKLSNCGVRIVEQSFRSTTLVRFETFEVDLRAGELRKDGSNLVQISNPRYQSGSPQWSPDGRKIAFDSLPSDRWEIFVADVSEGVPRKLTTNVSGIARPHWSHDGKWIYFMSNVTGRMGVFRCPAQGGDAVALSKDNAGVEPQESFDGGTIYYASGYNKPVLKRVAQQTLPGTASEVDGLPHVLFEAAWTPAAGGIYFVPADSPRSLRYFDFATKQIRPVFEADTDFNGGHSGLSVSSDGRWILYSQDDKVNGDIMLVDHFH